MIIVFAMPHDGPMSYYYALFSILILLRYRCGHTLTPIVGPDGDINCTKLILFGM